MAKKRKVVQFCLGGEGNAELFCLCDDGSLWKRCATRSQSGEVLSYQWVEVEVVIPDAG